MNHFGQGLGQYEDSQFAPVPKKFADQFRRDGLGLQTHFNSFGERTLREDSLAKGSNDMFMGVWQGVAMDSLKYH
jgi:hypothetical protein